MVEVKIYERTTRMYIGTILIDRKEFSKYEREFIVVRK